MGPPRYLLSATLFCTGALPGGPREGEVPGPSEELLTLWATLGEPRDEAAELDWLLSAMRWRRTSMLSTELTPLGH